MDGALKSLARTPLLLWLIKEAGQGSEQLPRNRGELFDKFVMNKLLEREKKLELAEAPEIKKRMLAQLAFALQQDHQLACNREWAEETLAKKGWGDKTGTLIREALLHGLLLQQNLPGKQLLRFMHQSVQEYFVALTLYAEAQMEREANFFQKATRQLTRHSLTHWAKDDWWNESFVQSAGLVEDADWLAWWCVEEGRKVQEATRNLIEARSVKLLSSERVAERRRAVQTLVKQLVFPLLQQGFKNLPERRSKNGDKSRGRWIHTQLPGYAM